MTPTDAISDLFPETLQATPPAPAEPTLAEFETWLCNRRYTVDGMHRVNIDSALFALWDFREEMK